MNSQSVAAQLVEVSKSARVETALTIALDWVDGPLTGFIELTGPRSYWYFDLFAERAHYDDVDDRLFTLTPVHDLQWQTVLSIIDCTSGRTMVVPTVVDREDCWQPSSTIWGNLR